MTYEEEIIAKNSTEGLKRNKLTRSSKKLMMEFDAQYSNLTNPERDAFLDQYFSDEI